MILYLDRLLEHGCDGTFGILAGEGATERLAWVLEPPWRANARGLSRIPPGAYRLVPHDGTQYTGTWALVGEGVAHDEEPGVARFGIVLHVGNTVAATDGCLCPGDELGELSVEGTPRRLGVLKSRVAYQRVLKATGRDAHESGHLLVIREGRIGGRPPT